MKKIAAILLLFTLHRSLIAQQTEIKMDIFLPLFNAAALSLEVKDPESRVGFQFETLYQGGLEGYRVEIVSCPGECGPSKLPNDLETISFMPGVRYYLAKDRDKKANWFIAGYFRSDFLLFKKDVDTDWINIPYYSRIYNVRGSKFFLYNGLGITAGAKFAFNHHLLMETSFGADSDVFFTNPKRASIMGIPSLKLNYRL